MGSRAVRIAVVIIAVTVIIAGLLIIGGRNSTPPSSTANTPHGNSTGSRRGSGNPVAGDRITIQNFTFSPPNMEVKQGTLITWINRDSTTHTVTGNDGNGLASPVLNRGQSYSFRFGRVGTFHYHCTIHPEMTGTVTVTP